MSFWRGLLLTLALSVLGAILGAWGGSEYVLHARVQPPLHELLHHRLHLTVPQHEAIEALEHDHAAREQALKAEMRAANADLATAFQQDHAYTPRVQASIDRFHHAMAELQQETLMHVLAMRRVLSPGQAAEFDRTVVESLSADPR